jgi:hypothetical protein
MMSSIELIANGFGADLARSVSIFDFYLILATNPLRVPIVIPFQLSYILSAVLAWKIPLDRIVHIPFATGEVSVTKAGKGIDSLIITLESRIREINTRITIILCLTVLSIFASVVVVIFAGKLTSLDAEAVSNLVMIKQDISSLDDTIDSGARS